MIYTFCTTWEQMNLFFRSSVEHREIRKNELHTVNVTLRKHAVNCVNIVKETIVSSFWCLNNGVAKCTY